jgi:protein-serine/threonine kinase
MGCCEKKKPEQLLEKSIEQNKDEVLNISDTETKLDNSQNEENNAELEQTINVKVTFNDFEPLKLLGRGSFGEVLLVRLKANQKVYAMKILSKNLLKIKRQQIHTKTERDLMVKINCPFIVNIKSAFQDIAKLYIVSEFMQGGDMFYHMHDGKIIIFNNDKTRFYIMELVLALEFLHKNNMVYRDLKPENILLDAKGHIKLTDFGLSKILETESDKAFTICGTPQYLAPEILQKKGYNKAVDWWSLGCVMYEMLTGKIPFAIKRGVKLNMKIYEQGVKYPDHLYKNAKDLIKKLLVIDPNERLGSGPDGSENIKKHPFFKGINWNDAYQRKIKPPFIPKLKNDTDLRYFDTMFTEEPINGNQRKYTRDRDREPSNEYNGFSYVTGSVSNELMTFAKNNEDNEDNESQ